MGGGFGGCTINLVKEELYDNIHPECQEISSKKNLAEALKFMM